jgi:hypothetical protein
MYLLNNEIIRGTVANLYLLDITPPNAYCTQWNNGSGSDSSGGQHVATSRHKLFLVSK